MNKIEERKKMIAAMEYVARQINDEEVFASWLLVGVADGDIPYGDLTTDNVDEYYVDDDTFKEIMGCFLRRMVGAYNSGGLYCGGVVSLTKEDYKNLKK